MIFKKYLLVFVATFFVCTGISFSTGQYESVNTTTKENKIDAKTSKAMERIRKAKEKRNSINAQNSAKGKLNLNPEFKKQLEEHISGKKGSDEFIQ